MYESHNDAHALPLDCRERHVATAQRSDRRPDRRPDVKLDTSDPSRGMPLDSTHILHTWMKYYADDQSTNRMPTEPDKHDLLGFPGVEVEDPKWYIRRLWLVADNDRKPFPKFLDKEVVELAKHVNKVVNTNEPGPRPRWGVDTDSEYEKNDEDSIQMNLRYWMAARIQAKINAPYKEKKCVTSVTGKHIEQPLPEPASQSRPQRPKLAQQGVSSDTPELAPSSLAHREKMVAAEPKADSNRSRGRACSNENDSDDSFSFTSFMHTDSEADLPRARNNRSKRRRIDTRSPEQDLEVTSTAGANLPSDITDIIIPDDNNNNNNNNNNIDVDEGGSSQLSGADEIKRKLQLDLTRFLNKELDYAGILREVIPPTRKLYADSPYRKPYTDLEVEFRNFNRALDHWESLIKRLTASSGVTPSPLEDPLQELAAQETFEDRVARLNNLGPRSHIDFPLERWTISLALFFEGLLGDTYIPLPFEDLVNRLRDANQSLYDTVHYSK
ncbi:hypothetical protein BDW02DRAFT_652237 [Decorospora gaudefroyi]|uniref:Uncharacterized protein n=1 Tax=Decorospora gaudefroyi TaxID=184978 RepID=A0A6A5JX10_9PLEO|nr:hypothetical protein BDW02DRAFT_652237 [Decorospora gaudefroyi]